MPEDPGPTLETIAEEIRSLSERMRKFNDGPLKRRAVVILLKDITGLNQGQINAVLDGLEALEDHFLKPIEE